MGSDHKNHHARNSVRLSAGRMNMSREGQAMFFAGANSIFAGDKLLTTPNPDVNEDMKMFEMLGLNPQNHKSLSTTNQLKTLNLPIRYKMVKTRTYN
jgi:biotin synthase